MLLALCHASATHECEHGRRARIWGRKRREGKGRGRGGRDDGKAGKAGKVGNVGEVGEVGKVGNAGQVRKVGTVGREGRVVNMGKWQPELATFPKSGHPESNKEPSDHCLILQSDALPTEL